MSCYSSNHNENHPSFLLQKTGRVEIIGFVMLQQPDKNKLTGNYPTRLSSSSLSYESLVNKLRFTFTKSKKEEKDLFVCDVGVLIHASASSEVCSSVLPLIIFILRNHTFIWKCGVVLVKQEKNICEWKSDPLIGCFPTKENCLVNHHCLTRSRYCTSPVIFIPI